MGNSHSIEAEIKEGKIYAMIAYWFFLCIVPLIFKKDNKFAVFHGKQGLVLFICFVAGFLFNVIPYFGEIAYKIIFFIYTLLLLWGSIQALAGNYSRIPVIADIADKISL